MQSSAAEEPAKWRLQGSFQSHQTYAQVNILNASLIYCSVYLSLDKMIEWRYGFLVCLSDEGYWVGKASLRRWRQLALEQLDEDDHETKHSNGETNGEGPHINSKGGRMFLLLHLLIPTKQNPATAKMVIYQFIYILTFGKLRFKIHGCNMLWVKR